MLLQKPGTLCRENATTRRAMLMASIDMDHDVTTLVVLVLGSIPDGLRFPNTLLLQAVIQAVQPSTY